jgi:hypothetical protein
VQNDSGIVTLGVAEGRFQCQRKDSLVVISVAQIVWNDLVNTWLLRSSQACCQLKGDLALAEDGEVTGHERQLGRALDPGTHED